MFVVQYRQKWKCIFKANMRTVKHLKLLDTLGLFTSIYLIRFGSFCNKIPTTQNVITLVLNPQLPIYVTGEEKDLSESILHHHHVRMLSCKSQGGWDSYGLDKCRYFQNIISAWMCLLRGWLIRLSIYYYAVEFLSGYFSMALV